MRSLREQVRALSRGSDAQWPSSGARRKNPSRNLPPHGRARLSRMRHAASMAAPTWVRWRRCVCRRTWPLELRRFSSSVLVHTDMSAVHITLRGTPEQKQKYLPGDHRGETICSIAVTEPDAGSDVAGLKTRARRDGARGDQRRKMFITNAVYGDILIVARVPIRTQRAAAASRCHRRAVDAGGISVKKLDKHGWLLLRQTAEIAFGSCIPLKICWRGKSGLLQHHGNVPE